MVEQTTPQAFSSAPVAPTDAAAAPGPAAPLGQAPPAPGAVQPVPAGPPKRSRAPRGPVAPSTVTNVIGIPALLELGAASPMYTEQRRAVNYFVPDASFLYMTLGICDQMMTSTDRFLRSSPGWLPIISQLYVSILWLTTIVRNYVNSGYAPFFAQLLEDLETHMRINECLVPGPLVPFFSALAAVNGPYDWIGDIVPAIPNATDFLYQIDDGHWCLNPNFCRSLPFPALLLDQLAYFATWQPTAPNTVYGSFQWYRNQFSSPRARFTNTMFMTPDHCGSIFTTETQTTQARSFWNPILRNFTRVDATDGHDILNDWIQLFGFSTQADEMQTHWFQHVAIIMQKYCQYFNGSIPLKAISPTGIGAVSIYGRPVNATNVRRWLYPQHVFEAFLTSHFPPVHEIPDALVVTFQHADIDAEEIAEQYALTTHTNMQWAANIATQHAWTAINRDTTHSGSYWTMMAHRLSNGLRFKTQYAQLIASRYHQQAALKTT